MENAGDGEWKPQAASEPRGDVSVARSWQWREMGRNVPGGAPNRTQLEHMAEDKLVHKDPLNLKCCDLPGHPRSTFLMVFSPDGKTVASTHGNHNIYLTELATGKHMRILKGHPRTPWCISFHPSHPQLVGSGCLGGQVRVWDLSGGSEVWTVAKETVIASIAFHPRDQLLVVATHNELYFWDWSQHAPFSKVCTNSINEKVRYVAFDHLGHKLITGISIWNGGSTRESLLQPTLHLAPEQPDSPRDSEDLIVSSYHNLVQRYDSLVRNYHRLFLARSQAANTTDRGTDPMEEDVPNGASGSRPRGSRPTAARDASDIIVDYLDSRRRLNPDRLPPDIYGEGSSANSSQLDRPREDSANADSGPAASQDAYTTHMFGSRPSAFQPLDTDRRFIYSASSSYNRRYLHRVLPNPFSSRNDLRNRSGQTTAEARAPGPRDGNETDELSNAFSEALVTQRQRRSSSSRTRPFTSPADNERDSSVDAGDLTRRTLSFERLLQMRGIPQREPDDLHSRVGEDLRRRALDRLLDFENTTGGGDNENNNTAESNDTEPETIAAPVHEESTPELADDGSPHADHRDVHARAGEEPPASESAAPAPDSNLSIAQSLDIIRDILRDSGTRLLNLITDLSYSTLAGVDGVRTGERPRDPSDLYTVTSPRLEGAARRRANRAANTSSSETDSDHSLEVNIFRSRDASASGARASGAAGERTSRPTGRMVVNLDLTEPSESTHTLNNNTINITVCNNRFRLRTNNSEENSQSGEGQSGVAGPSESQADTNRSITLSFPVATRHGIVTKTMSFPRSDSPPETANDARDTAADAPETANDAPETANDAPEMENDAPETENVAPQTVNDAPEMEAEAAPSPAPEPCASPEPTGMQRAEQAVDLSLPSTSRDAGSLSLSEQRARNPMIAVDALRKVKLGVEALQQHTSTLTDMWLRGTRTSMRELRLMWEDLRRQIVALHRQTGRTESSVYFARSLLERCHMLTDLSRRALNRTMESFVRGGVAGTESATTETAVQANVAGDPSPGPSTSRQNAQDSSGAQGERASTSRADAPRTPAQAWGRSRRLSAAVRSALKSRANFVNRLRRTPTGQRPHDDGRRRLRIEHRIEQYLLNARGRSRHQSASRSVELHFTRHEIRVRAMQVLSMMFNVMMACLEEEELSGHIMVMLRTLKRALGVTCLLLMTNSRRQLGGAHIFRRRNSTTPSAEPSQGSSQASEPPPPERNTTTPADSETLDLTVSNRSAGQTVENDSGHSNPRCEPPSAGRCANCSLPLSADASSDVVMAGPPEPERPTSEPEPSTSEPEPPTSERDSQTAEESLRESSTITIERCPEQSPASFIWSSRLAVQISAANQNLSDQANRRREKYLERKRMKALHRYNPTDHPPAKRKATPLVSNRIPSSRQTPSRRAPAPERAPPPPPPPPSEPAPGPSHPRSATPPPPLGATRLQQEYRAGLFRFAQVHAARLRNATRNRFRIRLYTPSSVREMFDILAPERDQEPGPSSANHGGSAARRAHVAYRPHVLTVRNDLSGGAAPGGVPLVRVNNAPVEEGPPPPPPRISEYLQPIILAQHSLAVEEAMGGGLLEAGLISESLVPPVHRVQAWDFTRGEEPDIKDSTKNVVVQRCKIHNDASIDVSRDGRLLVALVLPAHRMRNTTHRLCVYSLEWARLGACLHTVSLEQGAVSVALSPTARHLAVGLGSRRVTMLPHARNDAFALLFRLADEGPANENSRQWGLVPMRVLDHNFAQNFTSLNCLRWAPEPGQGLLYANNTGQLIIMS